MFPTDQTHDVAGEKDMQRLFEALNRAPHTVVVRDMFNLDYVMLFTDFADGPYLLKQEGSTYFIRGSDIATGERKDLKIVDAWTSMENVVFLRTLGGEWTPAGFVGTIRLFIPKEEG